MKKNEEIPAAFKIFFWDADFTKLKLPEHQNYVLNKLMAYGDIASINWILRTFDHSTVSRYVEKKGEYALDKKSYLFWKKIIAMDDLWV